MHRPSLLQHLQNHLPHLQNSHHQARQPDSHHCQNVELQPQLHSSRNQGDQKVDLQISDGTLGKSACQLMQIKS